MVKKFENMFTGTCFDTIHERDGQTDEHRTTAQAVLLHYITFF